ncbi:hypothetical protein AVDCRST_MAG84-2707 [uncultured Microcoleus sp.]|uniref:Uncharacterized protein n=1 Tax=uncultured Microcoleus sp. TaxID=259945 RepID=A0A6J4M1V4_9CYAN|nr:hypothetical protein AVDCRST_MAG84-2707 [uncultured Microcoleus sp.]
MGNWESVIGNIQSACFTMMGYIKSVSIGIVNSSSLLTVDG